MLVVPFLAAALVALALNHPALTVGFVCLAVCDYWGEQADARKRGGR